MRLCSSARSAMRLLMMLLLATTASVTKAIYPDDHWDYSTELTEDNFESHIQTEIDAGKTVFAPAWNEAVRMFAGHKDSVSFADVNLSENHVRRGPPYNPGRGGWPTIRYFNKETGLDGAPYKQKTDMKVCDELGPNTEYLLDYIEEAGKTSLCNVRTGELCDERSLEFLHEMKEKNDLSHWKEQFVHLENILENPLQDELKHWAKKRKKILANLVKHHHEL